MTVSTLLSSNVNTRTYSSLLPCSFSTSQRKYSRSIYPCQKTLVCSFLAVSSMVVQFEQGMYDVQEDVGTTMVCVEVAALPMGGLDCDIEITLSTMDGAKASMFQKLRSC